MVLLAVVVVVLVVVEAALDMAPNEYGMAMDHGRILLLVLAVAGADAAAASLA
jgi:hypothetical protein